MTYLNRCTGQTDMTVGAPVANRDQPNLQNLVALVVNTIALRFRSTRIGTFRQAVDHCGHVLLQALEYQALPFERVVERVQPQRGIEMNPLFQIMVAHQNVDSEPLELHGAQTTRGPDVLDQARLELEITTWRRQDGLEVRVGGRAPHYDRPTVQRIAEQLEVLLTQAGQRPDDPLPQLAIVPTGESGTLARWGQGPDPVASPPATLHGLVAEQVARSPSAPAIETRRGVFTFADVERLALRVAHALSGSVRPHDVVGIAVDRDESLVVSMLGALRVGATILPLNLRDPVARRQVILADAGARVVIVTTGTGGWLPASAEAVHYPSDPSGGTDAAIAELAGGPGRADDLAYLMYTSGTTGRPKLAV
jgi:non-ribosomal peptide synthetase component F